MHESLLITFIVKVNVPLVNIHDRDDCYYLFLSSFEVVEDYPLYQLLVVISMNQLKEDNSLVI